MLYLAYPALFHCVYAHQRTLYFTMYKHTPVFHVLVYILQSEKMVGSGNDLARYRYSHVDIFIWHHCSVVSYPIASVSLCMLCLYELVSAVGFSW